jgi:hypothetical protein
MKQPKKERVLDLKKFEPRERDIIRNRIVISDSLITEMLTVAKANVMQQPYELIISDIRGAIDTKHILEAFPSIVKVTEAKIIRHDVILRHLS